MTRLLLALSALVLAVPPASALTVTLNGLITSSLRSVADDGVGITDDVLLPAAVPFQDDHSVALGGSSSTTVYDFSNTGFEITFSHAREGTRTAVGRSSITINFSVDEDVDYVLEGIYTATDPDGRQVLQDLSLVDNARPDALFFGQQISQSTANERFVLGLAEGDFSNSLSGSLSGTLIAGREYILRANSWISALPTASPSSATATGYFKLSFVPEPTSALLLAPGLAALVTGRRRPRQPGARSRPTST